MPIRIPGFRARLARTLLGFLVTAAALVTFARPAGAVTPPVAMLSVTSPYSGWYDVRVSGYIPMSRTHAEARLSLGQYVRIRLWDYDFGNPDDLILDSGYDAYKIASSRGLEFNITWRTYAGKLNNDIGCETLYAGVRLMDGSVTVTSAESNRVGGCFG